MTVRTATVLPAPTSPVTTPMTRSATHQPMRATASSWACVAVQHAGGEVTAEGHAGEPVVRPAASRSRVVLPAGAAVDQGELLLGGVEVAGQGCGGDAGAAEEQAGGPDGEARVVAEVVAEAAAVEGVVEVAGDLGQHLAEAGCRQGQGAEDVVGGGRLAEPPGRRVAWARPRTASAAWDARAAALPPGRASLTGAALACVPERGVVDAGGGLPAVLLAEQGEVVDAGGAGGVVAGGGGGGPWGGSGG